MIPPQALHAVGLTLAKAAAYGIARLTGAGIDRLDDIRRLSKLDEPSLLVEIAHRDNANPALDKPHKIQYGRATVNRLLPKAQALICPHRDVLLRAIGSPEIPLILSVANHLAGGTLPVDLVNPIATLLVKRGLPLLCGKSSPSATGIAR
jgi:hypothetical protein